MAQTLRVTELSATVTMQTLRVTELQASISAAVLQTLRVTELSVTTAASPSVKPQAPQSVAAFDLVTIVATPSSLIAVPDTYNFRLAAGRALLTGTGDKRQFIAPAEKDGIQVIIAVSGTKAGLTSQETMMVVNVGVHNFFQLQSDGTWLGVSPMSVVGP